MTYPLHLTKDELEALVLHLESDMETMTQEELWEKRGMDKKDSEAVHQKVSDLYTHVSKKELL